jgi:glycosyltransferase involved in cell wall biosynthesis
MKKNRANPGFARSTKTNHGAAMIATAAGGNPEVIDHGVNGYLYGIGEREKMRMYVSNLLRDSTLRAKIVAAAKRKVSQFSEERMAEETAKLLKKI